MIERYEVLEQLIKKHGWQAGAELGVLAGDTIFHLLETCPTLYMVGVDRWEKGEPVQVPAPSQLPSVGYAPGSDDVAVVLDLDPSARWLEAALLVDEVEEVGDDTTRVRLRTDAPRWVARLVLMAGGGARVVAPDPVADEVVAMAQAALSGR
jgi:hypothetical protein